MKQKPKMNTSAPVTGVWENPVKQLLREGKPAIGLVISVNHVDVAAHAANLGFDFLWVEMEHTPVSLDTLHQIVLATRGLKAMPFARVPVNELWTAKRILDAGAIGAIFPFTNSAELARQAVSACKYPPLGRRGAGADLAGLRWAPPEGYYDFADRNVMVITVIEDARALDEIDEIAATPGIDVIFIGTSDLSFSLGLRGRQNEPKLQAAIDKIVAAAKKHNKPLGRPAATPEDIQRYMKDGFLFFMTCTELGLMTSGARQLLGPLGKSAVAPGPQTLL